MRKGTTPTVRMIVEGVDLTGAAVYAYIGHGNVMYRLTGNGLTVTFDGTDTIVETVLTQAQTLSLKAGTARVQVRWVDEFGHAGATDIADVDVNPILKNEVISYE